MKIFVVKQLFPDEGEQMTIGYGLTYGRAKKLAREACSKNWVIEEQPIGRRLDPRERREAWSTDRRFGDKLIPAGVLVGPYDNG